MQGPQDHAVRQMVRGKQGFVPKGLHPSILPADFTALGLPRCKIEARENCAGLWVSSKDNGFVSRGGLPPRVWHGTAASAAPAQ